MCKKKNVSALHVPLPQDPVRASGCCTGAVLVLGGATVLQHKLGGSATSLPPSPVIQHKTHSLHRSQGSLGVAKKPVYMGIDTSPPVRAPGAVLLLWRLAKKIRG
eukprot:1150797-Pelagomonas_calceolata.AAC.4